MIYLRCPFCDNVCVTLHASSGIIIEPYPNYYSKITVEGRDVDSFSQEVNGLKYFPHRSCYNEHMDVESRRKKLMEGLKLGQ